MCKDFLTDFYFVWVQFIYPPAPNGYNGAERYEHPLAPLKIAIHKIIQENEAIEDFTDQYGTYYKVIGELEGVNNNKLPVITVWQKRKADNKFYFITLKPNRVNQK